MAGQTDRQMGIQHIGTRIDSNCHHWHRRRGEEGTGPAPVKRTRTRTAYQSGAYCDGDDLSRSIQTILALLLNVGETDKHMVTSHDTLANNVEFVVE